MDIKIGLWAMFVLGLLLGLVIMCLYLIIRTSTGTLRIDQSNPEKDIYRLDLDDLDTLPKKKYVKLKVDTNADLSQN